MRHTRRPDTRLGRAVIVGEGEGECSGRTAAVSRFSWVGWGRFNLSKSVRHGATDDLYNCQWSPSCGKTSDFEEGQLKTKTDTKSDRHEEKSLAKSSDNFHCRRLTKSRSRG